MWFVCFRFRLRFSKLNLFLYSLWGKKCHEAIIFWENWEMAYCTACHSSRKPMIISSEAPNRFKKSCMNLNLNTYIRQHRRLSSIVLIKKKQTAEFVVEIEAMIKNVFSKSVGSISKDIRVTVFLIGQNVHEDIQ